MGTAYTNRPRADYSMEGTHPGVSFEPKAIVGAEAPCLSSASERDSVDAQQFTTYYASVPGVKYEGCECVERKAMKLKWLLATPRMVYVFKALFGLLVRNYQQGAFSLVLIPILII